MRNDPSAAVLAAIKRSSVPKGEDKLDKLRNLAREMRDTELELASLAERIKETQKKIKELQFTTMPEMFIEAGVNSIGLDAEGNLPAAEYVLLPFYKAAIAASWSDEDREAAFDHLVSLGLGDLIKTEVKVSLDKEDHAKAKQLEDALVKMRMPHTTKLDVHHATLTAVLREQVERGELVLDLDKIGGIIGSYVKRK